VGLFTFCLGPAAALSGYLTASLCESFKEVGEVGCLKVILNLAKWRCYYPRFSSDSQKSWYSGRGQADHQQTHAASLASWHSAS